MKLTAEEIAVRRERIMDTAFRLFCRDGIEQVTVSSIAREAGVGESTVYRYFTNKSLLVLATLNVLWRSIGARLERSAASYDDYANATGLQQISIHLDAFLHLYLDSSDYVTFSYEAKLYLQRNGISLSQMEFDQLMEEIRDPCLASLRKGKQDGSIPVEESEEDLFYAIWGSIRGYIVKMVIYDSLCREGNPWVGRYGVLKRGILSALASGWGKPPAGQKDGDPMAGDAMYYRSGKDDRDA